MFVVVASVLAGCAGHHATGAASPAAAGRAFLDRYVDPDGRVVRRDQGGDTVAEGQAYALLVAVALGDRATFERVWTWSERHLERDDGLLSWHWADGRIADAQSAADADLDTAHALKLAAAAWGSDDYARASRRIADAMRGAEIRDGVLVAGPWAKERGLTNPSYFDPRALAALHMDDVASATRAALAPVLRGSPPDWATLGPPAAASGPPNGSAPPGYGYDAARVPIRLAASCDPADRRVAAGLDVAGGADHPVFLVARAGVALAGGDRARADALLDDAAARDAQAPTYYGAAWVALGRLLFESDRLGPCPPG